MFAQTNPREYESHAPHTVTIYALEANKRPVGYAPWPKEKKRKKHRKRKDTS